MCLATVYKEHQETDSIILQFVSKIDIDGSKITLTDVMGETREVEGSIRSVDLAESTVIINCAE